jgi:hypothetical protein
MGRKSRRKGEGEEEKSMRKKKCEEEEGVTRKGF